MKIGVTLRMERAMDAQFSELRAMGMDNCQIVCWNEADLIDEVARAVKSAAQKHGVRVSAFWCGWPGPVTWDFYEGHLTLGLVPAAYRDRRTETLLKGSDFARELGAPLLVTHAGYLPENPYAPEYQGVLTALRAVARRCAQNGQSFLFETGQETPVTLRRVIEDLDMDNVGVNLDPANLLMYGKANPCDALSVLGKYVMGVHIKDGEYPTDGRMLGDEKAVGEGMVDFPRLIGRLKAFGYAGDYTIEREISGEAQKRDILKAKSLLESLI